MAFGKMGAAPTAVDASLATLKETGRTEQFCWA